MALSSTGDWQAFAYALAYVLEKESSIRILPPDANHDGSVTSPHSAVLDALVMTGGVDPADARAFADLYTANRQTREARGSFSVNALPAYGAPLSKFNSSGSL